jgi:hypothetical protein
LELQEIDPDPYALSELVCSFADPTVGAVSGELILESAPGVRTEVIRLYLRIEKWVREREAQVDSVIGATGAIYFIRRHLYQPLPHGTLVDNLLAPMQIGL